MAWFSIFFYSHAQKRRCWIKKKDKLMDWYRNFIHWNFSNLLHFRFFLHVFFIHFFFGFSFSHFPCYNINLFLKIIGSHLTSQIINILKSREDSYLNLFNIYFENPFKWKRHTANSDIDSTNLKQIKQWQSIYNDL